VVSSDSDTADPLIGISCYLEQTRFGVWDVPAAVLARGYLDGVVAAGGMPVLLPPVGRWDPTHLSRMDGLVIAGGPDIDPATYGQPPHPRTGTARPERDAAELRLIDLALNADLPVLAVCRGMQVLNVALGGTLRQHLPDVVGNTDHLPLPGTYGRIEVKIEPDSRLAGVLGDAVTVHCHHHQSVDRLGGELRPVGWAPDGTVEAVELPGAGFVVGIQWHPEEDSVDRRLFQALVKAVAP
jgi:putative glutamine amidotransferase